MEKEPIVGFSFCGKNYEVPNWQRLLVALCEILHEKHPGKFKGLNMPQVFSRSPNDLYDPKVVFSASVYVEGGYSDYKIKQISHELLELFGYQAEDLKLF